MSETVFSRTIAYLKAATLLGTFVCLLSIFFVGLDPWHALDRMIWVDLYGNPELPDAAKPAFTLAFLLFSWLSALTMILVFLITKYSLAKKEAWAFGAIILIGIFWPLGGAMIAYYTSAWSYLISVAMMTILFFPPVILLLPHFRSSQSPKV
ncbi:MAG: hypothetical protein K2U26_01315 [Cyclobacteriaceae bacterium]|nr:hypothetical protein [Cyclobacteriaceae bacterium]